MIFASCVALVIALALACLRAYFVDARWRDGGIAVVAIVSVAWLVACASLPVGDPRALLVLHEGGTACTLHSLFGQDLHAGPLWHDGLRWLARDDEPPLAWLGRVNFAFAGIALLAMVAATVVVSRSLLGGVLVFAMLVESRGFQMGMRSETPAPVLWFATVAALPAWCLMVDGARRTRRERLLSLLSLAACAALAVGVRTEAALVGVPLVCVALVTFDAGAGPVERAYESIRRVLRRLLTLSWVARGAALLVMLVVPRIVERFGFHARVLAVAALPSPDVLRLPFAVTSAVTLPVALLATAGVVAAFRRGPTRALTAWMTVQLLAVYLSASHNVGWEMLRYTMLGAALVWIHALAGWAAIERYAAGAGWAPAWRGSLALLLLAFVVGQGRSSPSHPGWWNASVRNQHVVVRQSKQRESEALVREVLRAPRCTFVARVRRDGLRDGPMVLATFGRRLPVRFAASPELTVDALHLEGAPCVRYFRTLDCNGTGGERCADDARGATPERMTTERWAAYSDPEEYGVLAPVVTYGVLRLADRTATASR